MSSWGNNDNAANSPLWGAETVNLEPTSANQTLLYGNTRISQIVSGVEVGVFGVDSTEANLKKNGAHTGWVRRVKGTGPVVSITANTGAHGANGYLTFTGGGTGSSAANAYMYVKTTGEVKNVVVLTAGTYSATPTAVRPTGGAANSTFTVTMGGRANREQQEVLAAMANIIGDGSDDTIYPDS